MALCFGVISIVLVKPFAAIARREISIKNGEFLKARTYEGVIIKP